MSSYAKPIEKHLEENAELISMWQAGQSSKEIGRALNLTRNAVLGRVDRMRKRGVSLREGGGAAHNLDAVLTGGDPIVMPGGDESLRVSVWTDERVLELTKLYAAGEGPTAIARQLAMTYTSTDRKIRRMRAKGLLADRTPAPIKRRVSAPAAPKKRSFRFGVSTLDQAETRRVLGQSILAAMEAEDTHVGVPLLSLKRFQCRAPTGGVGERLLSCGRPIDDGVKSSYCPKCRPRFVMGSVNASDLIRSLRKAYA